MAVNIPSQQQHSRCLDLNCKLSEILFITMQIFDPVLWLILLYLFNTKQRLINHQSAQMSCDEILIKKAVELFNYESNVSAKQ